MKFMVGECYANGWGVDLNEKEANHWYQIAANQGYEHAKDKLRKE